MRFFLSRRLPFGLRAGISVPLSGGPSRPQGRGGAVEGVAFCYVIQSADGLVKVGYTTNPQARLRQLQTASPHPLALTAVLAVTEGGAQPLEQETHRILAKHRLFGEWFDVTTDQALAAVDQASLNLFGKSVVDTENPAALPAPARAGAFRGVVLALLVVLVPILALFFGLAFWLTPA